MFKIENDLLVNHFNTFSKKLIWGLSQEHTLGKEQGKHCAGHLTLKPINYRQFRVSTLPNLLVFGLWREAWRKLTKTQGKQRKAPGC